MQCSSCATKSKVERPPWQQPRDFQSTHTCFLYWLYTGVIIWIYRAKWNMLFMSSVSLYFFFNVLLENLQLTLAACIIFLLDHTILKGPQQDCPQLLPVVTHCLSHPFLPFFPCLSRFPTPSPSYTGSTSQINQLDPNLLSKHALGVNYNTDYVQETTLITTFSYCLCAQPAYDPGEK